MCNSNGIVGLLALGEPLKVRVGKDIRSRKWKKNESKRCQPRRAGATKMSSRENIVNSRTWRVRSEVAILKG